MSKIVFRPSSHDFFEGYPLRISPVPIQDGGLVSPDELTSEAFSQVPAIPFAKISLDALEVIRDDTLRSAQHSPHTPLVFESNYAGDIVNCSFLRHSLSDTTIRVAQSMLKHAQVIAPAGCQLKINPRLAGDMIGDPTVPHIDEISRNGIKGIVAYPDNTLTYMGVIERSFVDVFDASGDVKPESRKRVRELMFPTPEGEMNLFSLRGSIHAAQPNPDSILMTLVPLRELETL